VESQQALVSPAAALLAGVLGVWRWRVAAALLAGVLGVWRWRVAAALLAGVSLVSPAACRSKSRSSIGTRLILDFCM
jgi:hypothetical protein